MQIMVQKLKREIENEKGAQNQRRRSFSGVLRILAAQRETGAASSGEKKTFERAQSSRETFQQCA